MNFLKIILLPIIRHGLNAICTWLVLKGLTDSTGASNINGLAETVTGIVIAGANLSWSIAEKHFQQKKISDQQAGTPPTTAPKS